MSDAAQKPGDDFDAVRMVVEVLKAFKPEEQSRIIRWAQEKLGIVNPSSAITAGAASPPTRPTTQPGGDIRSFIEAKIPKSDVQFAAAVAYYYAFVATTRKSEITATDLQEATRLANRDRLHNPNLTLHNAARLGYLDKGSDKGTFKINTVGENLIAMSLPTSGAAAARPTRAKAKARKRK